MTSAPSLRKRQALTLPSRRRAVSQRMVASEPVTDRFGPRSTPISRALGHRLRHVRGLDYTAGDKPAGRLLIEVGAERRRRYAERLIEAPTGGRRRAEIADERTGRRRGSSASTSTNSPATSGSTPHEMLEQIGQGD